MGHGAINLNPLGVDAHPGAADDFREGCRGTRVRVLQPPGEGRVSEGGAGLPRMPPRRRWRREGTKGGIANAAAWEPGGREPSLATPLADPRFRRGGRRVLQPGELADDENRRRRLVVSRSLTRVGLFFSLRARCVGENLESE